MKIFRQVKNHPHFATAAAFFVGYKFGKGDWELKVAWNRRDK